MITENEARKLAFEWRGQFEDEVEFQACWQRYFESAIVPDAERLRGWLANGVQRGRARAVGAPKEPILPTSSHFRPRSVCVLPSNHEGDHEWSNPDEPGCYHCGGKGYVRKDVGIDHADFGKAFRCPDCNR